MWTQDDRPDDALTGASQHLPVSEEQADDPSPASASRDGEVSSHQRSNGHLSLEHVEQSPVSSSATQDISSHAGPAAVVEDHGPVEAANAPKASLHGFQPNGLGPAAVQKEVEGPSDGSGFLLNKTPSGTPASEVHAPTAQAMPSQPVQRSHPDPARNLAALHTRLPSASAPGSPRLASTPFGPKLRV